jgi:hypothetical protein
MEMSGLVNAVLFQAGPHAASTAYYRLPEQIQLGHLIAGREADYPAARKLAGAGQGFEVFAAARDTNAEIEAKLRELAARQ